MSAMIECETPNEYLYKFEGNFVFQNGEKIPLDPDQILLKGSNLRNTEWVLGLCVFTGHDTKIMNNTNCNMCGHHPSHHPRPRPHPHFNPNQSANPRKRPALEEHVAHRALSGHASV